MDSERIPCGLPHGQASEYDKKYFLTLDSLWLATWNINVFKGNPNRIRPYRIPVLKSGLG